VSIIKGIGAAEKMTISPQLMTLEDYLNYDDGTDNCYELVNGELVAMPTESWSNQQIALFLLFYFANIGIPPTRMSIKAEIAVAGGRATVRVPDLTIVSTQLENEIKASNKGTIGYDLSPPQLVVEVVSPNQDKRDYRYKRSEYAARQIPEYWIVDPILNKVTILELVEGLYEETVYVGDREIDSPQFGKLALTAQAILAQR
jgi:Uma2 family endonuclease